MKVNDDYGFEIVTDGTFIDQGFKVRTVVIRIGRLALDEWGSVRVLNDRYVYDTREEYELYINKKEKKLKAWEDKILNRFSFKKREDGGYCITNNVSEIFTVVMFEKIII